MILGNCDYYQSFVDIANEWFCGYFSLASSLFIFDAVSCLTDFSFGERQCRNRIVIVMFGALFLGFVIAVRQGSFGSFRLRFLRYS